MWLGAAAAVAATAGCATRSDSGIESETPRITEAAGPGVPRERLLTAADVRAAGWPEVVVGDLDDVPLFENPDPRGPCGGVVTEIPLDGAVGRSFGSPAGAVIELLLPADDQVVLAFEALQADVSPSCGPYLSRTNTGDMQTVSDIELVDLAIAGAESVAWTSTVTVRDQSVDSGAFMLVVGDHAAFVQIHSPEPVAAGQVRELAGRAADRLAGAS